jgi:ParB-like chromosome segregation protein Spo0J
MEGGVRISRLEELTRTAGYNAGAEAYAKWMDPREIKINRDIAKLFENDSGVVGKIRESMAANGFYKSEPLVIWKGTGCVVDGHTRLKAALEAGIDEVLVEENEFAEVSAVKIYTLTRQLNRRNLTAGALLETASLLDAMKEGRAGETWRRTWG